MNYVKKTVEELLKINTKQAVVDFIKELSLHAEKGITVSEDMIVKLVDTYYMNQRVSYPNGINDNIAKIMSWIDCLEFLQKYFDGKIQTYAVKLCFEYNTPDNAWLDVVVLDNNRITIFEFKSGSNKDNKTLEEYEEQLDEYCNKLSHANVNIWGKYEQGLTARGFLVYTNEKMKNIETRAPFVINCEEFDSIASSFNGYMDDLTEEEVMNFEPELDSSTLAAFVDVLNGRVLDNVYVPDICKERCIDIIDAGIGKNEAKVNIIFVNGKPGAGKTGVALALVSEYMQRKKQGKSSLKIKYATGNGNLYSLFTQAASTTETKGTTGFVFSRIRDLYRIDDIVNEPGGYLSYSPKTKEDIIVVDEAQRMWSSEKIAFDHSTENVNGKYVYNYYHDRKKVLLNSLSEPVMVLRDIYKASFDSSSEKTVIFLIGNGQEIYTGEELGEEQIIQAVQEVSTMFGGRVLTRVYASKKFDVLDKEIQDNSEKNVQLYLQTEKRNRLSKNTGAMVDSLFNNTIMPDKNRTPFVVVGTKEELNTRFAAIKNASKYSKQRLFIDSYDQGKMENFMGKKRTSITNAQLYDFFKNDLGADMKYFATEFNAQGLEIDYAYFVWNDRIKRVGNEWVVNTKGAGQIYYYYKDIEKFSCDNPDITVRTHNINEEIKKMIINAYRVLLTRAQKKTIIYVEDKDTRDYLRKVLG